MQHICPLALQKLSQWCMDGTWRTAQIRQDMIHDELVGSAVMDHPVCVRRALSTVLKWPLLINRLGMYNCTELTRDSSR